MGNFHKLYFQRRTGPPLRYQCHDVYSTRSIAQVHAWSSQASAREPRSLSHDAIV
jgi:hypothetical protein